MRLPIAARLIILLAALAPLAAPAQSGPDRGPDGNTRTITPGIEVPPYPGLPFTGTDTILRTRSVEGGSVTTAETSQVIRDSDGRLYRERHHFGLLNADPQKTLYAFYVLDPTTHTRTECLLATHACNVSSYHPRLSFPLQPAGPFDEGKRILVRQSLGPQITDGLTLTGTRETITILPGIVGNDHALTLTRDFWYFPDLKTNIKVIRTDPREGTEAIHLEILSRTAPDPSAFVIPASYTVTDLRHTPGR
ncbi:MAG: hypothetical protein ACRYFU_23900 [Janthinobacterium lividum]